MPTDLNLVEVPQIGTEVAELTFAILPSQEAVAGAARVLEIEALDDGTGIHIRVTFVRPVQDNEAVRCLDVYRIISPMGARTIHVVAIETEGSPVASVVLTVDEMLDAAAYGMEIDLLEEA